MRRDCSELKLDAFREYNSLFLRLGGQGPFVSFQAPDTPNLEEEINYKIDTADIVGYLRGQIDRVEVVRSTRTEQCKRNH